MIYYENNYYYNTRNNYIPNINNRYNENNIIQDSIINSIYNENIIDYRSRQTYNLNDNNTILLSFSQHEQEYNIEASPFIQESELSQENNSDNSAPTHKSFPSSSFTCSICMEDEHNEVRHLPCCHSFCNDCITRWLQTNDTCPLCRAKVS